MKQSFYTLKVVEKEHLTANSTTLTLEVPASIRHLFIHHPGQYLVVRLKIEGQEVRRSYSINSNPFSDEPLQITIKCIEGGVVSNYIYKQIHVGDKVDCHLPQGRFYASVQKEEYKTYFLFAAGSGITPIFSILKAVLSETSDSYVHLFYGNINQDTILFNEALERLARQHKKRLNVVHTLSDPKVWTTWNLWKGRKGRIDAEQIAWFIQKYPPIAQQTEYFICGPMGMNVCVRNTLLELGVPQKMIHVEHFGSKGEIENKEIIAVDNSTVFVQQGKNNFKVDVKKGNTLLETLKIEGKEPNYSCESGVCGTCIAELKEGTVEMKSCMALDEEQVKKGSVLLCQAYPTSKRIRITYS